MRSTYANTKPTVLACAFLLCWVATQPVAQPAAAGAGLRSIEHLKAIFLACDRLSAAAVLPPHQVRSCSTAAEELKLRAFEGDFERLLAWWRAQRTSEPQAQRSTAAPWIPQE